MTKDIKVKLSVDGRQLEQGMNKAANSVEGFDKRTEQMAINVAKAGAVVVTSIAAITAGVIVMAKEAAAAGVEIKNLSAQAGIGTTEFQKMAAASRTVGFEQEKLSDILKDVNDKFGDYMATGAGPLADFFEQIAPKIGVTADMFAKLSGPDALQLYVSSLEKAGVSQQEMTFYMEALASDATRLLPLLRDNGLEMARLGDQAQRTGRIMDTSTIDAAVELDRAMGEMGHSLKTAVNSALLENSEELIDLALVITKTVIPAIGELAGFLAGIVGGLASVSAAAIQAAADLKAFIEADERNTGSAGRRDRRAGGRVEGEDAPDTGLEPGGPLGARDARGRLIEGTVAAEFNPGEGGEGGRGPMPERDPADAFDNSEQGRGGAGAGPSSDEIIEAQAEAHRLAYETRQEQLEELAQLELDNANKIVSIGETQEEKLAKMREKYAQQEINMRSNTADMAIGLLANLGQKSEVFAKAAVALNAAKAIGETIQNTAAASVRALADLGPIAGPPAAAKILTFGKIQAGIIAANAALSLGGGSSGGGGGGGASSISNSTNGGGSSGGSSGGGASEQQAATTFSFTLQNDPMGFGEGFARQMIDQLNKTQANGGQIRAVLNT